MPGTELLVFCRRPAPGRGKTRLAKACGKETAAALYRAFVIDLLHVCSALRAAHGARPEDAGLVATDADGESRTFSYFAFRPRALLMAVPVEQKHDDHRDNYRAE